MTKSTSVWGSKIIKFNYFGSFCEGQNPFAYSMNALVILTTVSLKTFFYIDDGVFLVVKQCVKTTFTGNAHAFLFDMFGK